MKDERGEEYDRLVREGRLAEVEGSRRRRGCAFGYVLGGTAVILASSPSCSSCTAS